MGIAHREARRAEHFARVRAERIETRVKHASGKRASPTERRDELSTSRENTQNALTLLLDTCQECEHRTQRGETCGARRQLTH